MKRGRLHVTDHAVLTYLERVHGVDIEGLRRRIARNADLACNLDEMLDGCTVTVKTRRGRYLVKDGKVVTVNPR